MLDIRIYTELNESLLNTKLEDFKYFYNIIIDCSYNDSSIMKMVYETGDNKLLTTMFLEDKKTIVNLKNIIPMEDFEKQKIFILDLIFEKIEYIYLNHPKELILGDVLFLIEKIKYYISFHKKNINDAFHSFIKINNTTELNFLMKYNNGLYIESFSELRQSSYGLGLDFVTNYFSYTKNKNSMTSIPKKITKYYDYNDLYQTIKNTDNDVHTSILEVLTDKKDADDELNTIIKTMLLSL